MNQHAQLEAQLSIYHQLTETERRAVDQHLATCPTCRTKLAAYEQQAHLLTNFVEQRQHALLRAQPLAARDVRTHAAYQQLLAWQTQPPTWFATWRSAAWATLRHAPARGALSWALVLMLVIVLVAALTRVESLRVAAQPTPVPTLPAATPTLAVSLEAARQGIEAALAREEAARNENDRARMAEYFDPDASDVWRRAYQAQHFVTYQAGAQPAPLRLRVAAVTVAGDFAQVRVQTQSEREGALATEEGRVYRHVGDQWFLTAPDTEAWGETRVLSTASFHIEYGAVDAEIVEAAAPRLEAAYQKLTQTLDLPQARPTAAYPYTPADLPYLHEGKIQVAFVPQFIDSWPVTAATLRLTSPYLSPLLQGSNAVDMPIYDVMARVGSALVSETKGDTYWHDLSVEQWLIEDSMENPPWRGSAFMEQYTKEFLNAYPVLHLDAIRQMNEQGWPIVVGNLLMDYIVDTYGRSVIPTFVRSLGTYETWDALIPAVFGRTLADFETGWNSWLDSRYPEQVQVAAARAGIEESLALEAQARTNRDESLLPHFIDPDANAGWQSVFRATNILHPREFEYEQALPRTTQFTLTVDNLQVVDDIASAHIRVTYTTPPRVENQRPPVTFVEGRFYRHIGERWLLTSPDQAWLGPNQELVTAHFRLRYSTMDGAVVKAAAPVLEKMYERLLANLGLSAEIPAAHDGTPGDGKIEFELVPYEVNTIDLNRPTTAVTSPFFAPRWPDTDPAAQLSYTMFQMLLHPIIDERLDEAATARWGPIAWGIRQWLAEDSLSLWSRTPMRLSAVAVEEALTPAYVVQLAELPKLNDAKNFKDGLGIGYTFMAYVVDTYGRATIAPLLQAMNTSESWDAVLPAILGVNASEFEAGWNAYLTEHVHGGADLIINGNFAQSLAPMWEVYAYAQDKLPGDAQVVVEEDRAVLNFVADEHDDTANQIRLTQTISRSITGTTWLILALDVQVITQSLPGAGQLGSEYPLAVEITYRNARGHQLVWKQGFYAVPPEDATWPLPDGQQVEPGKWVHYQSPNLLEVLADAPPTLIERVRLKAAGRNYTVKVTELHLWASP